MCELPNIDRYVVKMSLTIKLPTSSTSKVDIYNLKVCRRDTATRGNFGDSCTFPPERPPGFVLRQSYTSKTVGKRLTRRYPSGGWMGWMWILRVNANESVYCTFRSGLSNINSRYRGEPGQPASPIALDKKYRMPWVLIQLWKWRKLLVSRSTRSQKDTRGIA